MKRSVAIVRPARLSVESSQLLIENEDGKRTVPIEDLGILILDNVAIELTGPLLGRLGEDRVAVLVCGEKHLPTGLFLPYQGHSLMPQIMRAQIEAKLPTKKRLWQTVVKEKIRSQARHLLDRCGEDMGLFAISERVFSGDRTNREAVAATVYFSSLFDPAFARLRRTELKHYVPSQERLANALLNYGYAVIRAAVARAVVLAGLHPALGLHHRHRENVFCLADDLMEPLRVLADREACAALDTERELPDDLTPPLKRRMLQVLTAEVGWSGRRWPLDAALEAYASQVRQCLIGERKDLEVPVA